ncbi:MAG: N-(5'-phosphoribosyl)anthranilate isomerase [Syntrophus sp. PtaB.Bin138]|jgi:phosphoribosylanthranilate isomerase|nr:MAG: N-(5'-phosphoribosyl)anthranilate isomerase [Syntrophus sp. PtaB.Bin138]
MKTFGKMIQIAGVMDMAEARLLAAAGVTHLGFPLRLPVHREDLSDAEAAAIIARLSPSVGAVLITYLDEARDVAGLCRRLGVRIVQLHGEISPAEVLRLRRIAPELAVIKSVIVKDSHLGKVGAEVLNYAPLVDAFITDSWDPATGACGATGRVHDWDVSRQLAELSPKPLILAGGLGPENVRQAIIQVRPAGVDAHTGVERPDGRKDEKRVRSFVEEARAAFWELDAARDRG